MQSILTDHQTEISELCQKYHVKKLEAFGSVLRPDFNLHSSDIDFIVLFEDIASMHYADNFFGLQRALEELMNRQVDLVVASSINNPYFIERLNNTKKTIYEA